MTVPTREQFRELLRAFMSSDEYLDDFEAQKHVWLMLKDVRRDRVLYVNDSLCKAMGKTADELCGHSSKGWPEEYAAFHADDCEIIESGRPRFRYLEKTGTTDVGKMVITTKAPAEWMGEAQCVIVLCVDTKAFLSNVHAKILSGQTGRALQDIGVNSQLERMAEIIADLTEAQEKLNKAFSNVG